jgi:hypothetical protein
VADTTRVADLVPGQYVTVHGGGFFGWLIRTFTHAPVAHAYVYVGPQPDGYDLVEAQPKGVSFGHTSLYNWDTSFPSKTVPTPEQSEVMKETALALVGSEYGYLADFFIGMREGLHAWVPEWLFKAKSITSHYECAQLADFVAIAAGVHYFDDGRQPGSVSPADLWRKDYK